MSIIKFALIISFIFQTSKSLNIESIRLKNQKEKIFSINKRQSYQIIFDSMKEMPDYIQVVLTSLNNINQTISFSSSDEYCSNGEKYITNDAKFHLEKSQLSLSKNYICIECEYPFDYCEFKINLSSGKLGPNLKEKKDILKNYLVKLEENNENDDDITLKISSNLNIDIYTLASNYKEKISIPSNKYQVYKIDSGSSGTYRVISGNSVTVGKDGIIYPKNKTTYWYGNIGYSYPLSDKEPTSIVISYALGESKVNATVGTKSYIITVNVKDYASEYVENIIDAYIKTNVTTQKTKLDQLKAITAFPAKFPYSPKYQSYISMVIFEGGDCWASSNTIQHLCEKVGIKSHVRYAANDGGAGSGHRNVIAYIDKKYYICEAGYGSYSPNRGYSVYEEPFAFSTKSNKDGLVIYQYDGYDKKISVPDTINKKSVVGIENLVFYNGPGRDIKKVTLPDSITFIGKQVFNSLTNLTEVKIPKNVETIGLYVFAGSVVEKIKVDSSNKYFCSSNDILYNKNKTIIVYYPPGKSGETFEGPSSLEKFENYSFYLVKKLQKLYIPKNVKFISEGAFAQSSIKEIYFKSNPPILGNYIFWNINVTVYYPRGNKNWTKYFDQKFEAKAVYWQEWDIPKESSSSSKAVLACFLTIGGIVILAGIIILIIWLKKKRIINLSSLNTNFPLLSKQ